MTWCHFCFRYHHTPTCPRKAKMMDHVRVCTIRPKDILCDANGDVIGTVTVTAHPSPVDYDKTSEFTLEFAGGGRQDFELLSGTRVWRKR